MLVALEAVDWRVLVSLWDEIIHWTGVAPFPLCLSICPFLTISSCVVSGYVYLLFLSFFLSLSLFNNEYISKWECLVKYYTRQSTNNCFSSKKLNSSRAYEGHGPCPPASPPSPLTPPRKLSLFANTKLQDWIGMVPGNMIHLFFRSDSIYVIDYVSPIDHIFMHLATARSSNADQIRFTMQFFCNKS